MRIADSMILTTSPPISRSGREELSPTEALLLYMRLLLGVAALTVAYYYLLPQLH